MTFESAVFDELFLDTVTYEPWQNVDSHGGRLPYGTSKSVQAHIEQYSKLVTDHQGREVVSNTRVHMKPTATDGTSIVPTVKDRITLPSGYAEPRAPQIITVSRVNDEQGLHHFEVSL